MQIFDMTCPSCGTIYKAAVSDTVRAQAGQFQCQLCDEVVDKWDDARLRVYRMMSPTGHAYLHIPTAPPPIV